MEGKHILIFTLSLLVSVIANSQDNQNDNYFKSLKKSLIDSDKFSKTKYIETKYADGKLKSQRMFVKLKDSNTRKFWMIGKEYVYFKNGNLSYKSYTDTASLILSDTIFKYNIDGSIYQKIILGKSNDYHDVFIIQKMRLFKYSERWPYSYTSTFYEPNENHKYLICPYKFNKNKAKHLLNGAVMFYDNNGNIVKQEEYIMGKRQK